MNVYLVERKDYVNWCEDYAMVVVAEDKRHAERRARWESGSFKDSKDIKITEVSLEKEDVIIVANTGA